MLTTWEERRARFAVMSGLGRQSKLAGRPANVVAVAYDYGGTYQNQQAECHQKFGSSARASPLFQSDAPQCAENDDAGHVQRPTGELVPSHLGLTHGVEEKLHVPDGARESREQIVGKHRGPDSRVRGNGYGD